MYVTEREVLEVTISNEEHVWVHNKLTDMQAFSINKASKRLKAYNYVPMSKLSVQTNAVLYYNES